MGSTTRTNSTRSYDIIDPFSQFGIGDQQRQDFGQQLLGTGGTGLGQLERFATGDWGNFLKGIGGAVSSFGGIGGGAAPGGIGGIMGLGNEAMALKQDPFDDAYINTLLGRGTEATRGQHQVARQNMADYMLRSGITGPAAAGLQARQAREQAQAVSDTKKDQTLWAGQQKLENKRLLGQLETQLRGISRQAQASERAAMTARSAALGSAGIGARSALMGQLAGLGYDAAKTLGTGQSMRGFGQPFSIETTGTTQETHQSPGIAGLLGTGLAGASMFMGGGPMAGMFGGGKGGPSPVPLPTNQWGSHSLPNFSFTPG